MIGMGNGRVLSCQNSNWCHCTGREHSPVMQWHHGHVMVGWQHGT